MGAGGFRATYRLQLTPEFGFAAAREQIPYLRDLGISHLYLSPSLQARTGSPHGYDVVDPTRISEDRGGEREFRALADEAHSAGLGIVLDVVPNHMATSDANPFWSDPELRRRFFDIDPETGHFRRFFDIDDLAGVRQEDPEVFETTHRLVLSLVRKGLVDALRIDHPDGLADPAQYFQRLRDEGVETVWIEKILEPSEPLRDWPVTGTVGYEFLNDACAVFVDGDAEHAFTSLWRELSEDPRSFESVALEAKLEQAMGPFAPDIERLASEQEVQGGVETLARAVASFPVYRSYVAPETGAVTDQDRDAVGAAEMSIELAQMLLLERPARAAFVTRFQQTTPPVVAKGVEDTAFYRYARLLALCDVGGDPGRFGIDIETLHAANVQRAERFPLGMLTTMTHDSKRSSDVRARIAALSWIPEQWERRVRRWLELTEELCIHNAPDGLERYFVFQTLAGAWPIEVERIEDYMQKALREAKRNTDWIHQDTTWEEVVKRFCRRLVKHEPFLSDFEPFVDDLAFSGDRITLGMLALKLTSPGMPDTYQGDELPLRALVDPDNRRPVDWEYNQAMLGRLAGGAPPEPETRKLWLTIRLLGLRIRRPEAFSGAYEPVEAGERTIAYLRGDEVLVIVDTRPGVPEAMLETIGGRWRDVLSGDERSLDPEPPLSELLGEYGIAVLERI
ncbi:MAG: alpha-amylase family glycosyl hydrolase [Solirubrobacteraceae bacterium]